MRFFQVCFDRGHTHTYYRGRPGAHPRTSPQGVTTSGAMRSTSSEAGQAATGITMKEGHKMTTKHIHTSSSMEAWETVHGIISDVTKTEKGSARAGYPIYTSDRDGREWVSDLGNRLEVNRANGETVCIWIDPQEDGTVAAVEAACRMSSYYREEAEAEKAALRANWSTLYTPSVMIRVTVTVSDPGLDPDPDRALVWKSLRRECGQEFGSPSVVFRVMESYCKEQGIIWGTMRDPVAEFVRYGRRYDEGHFVCSCLIGPSAGKEAEFLGTCSRFLFQQHDEHTGVELPF